MAEGFRAMKEYKVEKRSYNTEFSTEILKKTGIVFVSKNNGAHLIIMDPKAPIADFWPSTGKFIFRYNSVKGRGVYNLIKQLQKERERNE